MILLVSDSPNVSHTSVCLSIFVSISIKTTGRSGHRLYRGQTGPQAGFGPVPIPNGIPNLSNGMLTDLRTNWIMEHHIIIVL